MKRVNFKCIARFVLGVLCLSFILLSTASAAGPGTITGSISSKPTASTFQLPNIVTAINVVPPFEQTSELAAGKFKLFVEPGQYVVLTQAWRGDALGYKTSSKFVIVKSGKTSKLNSRSTKSIRRLVAPSVPGGPNGPVISVGNLQLIGADGQPLKQTNGSDIRFDGVMDSALSRTARSCPFFVGADREFENFKEFEKELKRRSKTHPDPKVRKRLKRSLTQLPLWAPQYRLTGTISSGGPSFLVADLKIIDLATGKTVWCKRLDFAGGLLLDNFPKTVAMLVADTLCGKADLPKSVQGTFTGKASGIVMFDWGGNIKFVPTDPDPLKGKPTFAGVGIFTEYKPESVNFGNWSISGGDVCTVSGKASGPIDQLVGNAMFIEITGEECGERRYAFACSFISSTTTPITMNCGGKVTVSPSSWGGGLTSEGDQSKMSKFSSNTASGNFAEGNSTYTWNMTVTPP